MSHSDVNKNDVNVLEKTIDKIIGSKKKIIVLSIGDEFSHDLNQNNCTVIHNFQFTNPTCEQIQENLEVFFQKNSSKKFDILYLGNLLDNLDNPEKLFLFLHKNPNFSEIVFYFENPLHGSHRINYLNGNLPEIINLKNCNTLDSVLFLLENCGFSLTKFERLTENILNNDPKLIIHVISKELIDALNFDPESNVTHYLFSVHSNEKSKKPIREILNNFPNIMVTEYLKNILLYYKSQMAQKTNSDTPTQKNLFDKLVNDIEILQNVNVENKKLIKQYVEKINKLVKEIETLQKINLNHQKNLKDKDDVTT